MICPVCLMVGAMLAGDPPVHPDDTQAPQRLKQGRISWGTLPAGDFDPCEMKALLEEKFGAWHRQASEPDQVPAVPNSPIPGFAPGADTVYLVDRPGLTQVRDRAAVLFEHPNLISAQQTYCHTLWRPQCGQVR